MLFCENVEAQAIGFEVIIATYLSRDLGKKIAFPQPGKSKAEKGDKCAAGDAILAEEDTLQSTRWASK